MERIDFDTLERKLQDRTFTVSKIKGRKGSTLPSDYQITGTAKLISGIHTETGDQLIGLYCAGEGSWFQSSHIKYWYETERGLRLKTLNSIYELVEV